MHQEEGEEGGDQRADRDAQDEEQRLADAAQDRHDQAAPHDVALDTQHARQGGTDRAADHVGRDDRQRMGCGERNGAFGDPEEAHEPRRDAVLALRLVEGLAGDQGRDEHADRGDRDGD